MAENKKVTRITAKDDAPKKATAKATTPAKAVKAKAVKAPKATVATVGEVSEKKNIFARIGAYFKGAWYELRQVRWPNRKATWALTVAVTIFSLAFMGLIVLLDMLFKWLFEIIII